ncbi:MAG: hypothetical protein V3V40_06020 [Nitrosomonadaceae bacterium]
MNTPGEKYRPCNGSEGESFMEDWCFQCARDKHLSEGKYYDECSDDEVCGIVAITMAYDEEDDEYPPEWTYDDRGKPCCTAFLNPGDEIKVRCSRTTDMFK